MALDASLVRHIAKLARIELSEEEVALFSEQLTNILDHVDQLKKLDVSQVEPFVHSGEFTNVFREDKVTPPLEKKEALQNAPSQDGNFFKVPKIIG